MHHSSTVFVTFVFFHSECRSWRTLTMHLLSRRRGVWQRWPRPRLFFHFSRNGIDFSGPQPHSLMLKNVPRPHPRQGELWLPNPGKL